MRLLPLLLLLLVALVLASGLFNTSETAPEESHMVGYHIRDFSIPSLLTQDPLTPAVWKDKIVIVNFFASWCEGCILEHPVLMRLAESRKVEIVGIAWKDKPSDTMEWLKKHGNPFHHIGVDEKGDTTLAFGLSGAPETFIIDSKNMIAYNYKAPITDELLDTIILPMIEHLRTKNAPPAANR